MTSLSDDEKRERRRQKDARYRVKNREKIAERDRLYRERNADKIAEQKREYRSRPENRERESENKSEYHQANRDRILAYQREWRQLNPEKASKGRIERRARLLSVEREPYTASSVLELYGSVCYLCGFEIDLSAPRHAKVGAGWELGLHIDHVIPLIEKGPDTLSNVRPSHAICNLRKGSQYCSPS
jgi:hypothetical protein